MNRLRKLILLVPLMLLAAVTNSWGQDTYIDGQSITLYGLGASSTPYWGGDVDVNRAIFQNDITTDDQIVVKPIGVTDKINLHLKLTPHDANAYDVFKYRIMLTEYNVDGSKEIVFNVSDFMTSSVWTDTHDSYNAGASVGTITGWHITNSLKWGKVELQGAGNGSNPTFDVQFFVRKKGADRSPLCLTGQTSLTGWNEAGALKIAAGQLQDLAPSSSGSWANPGICFKIKGKAEGWWNADWMYIVIGDITLNNRSTWSESGYHYRWMDGDGGNDNRIAYIWCQFTNEMIEKAKTSGVQVRGGNSDVLEFVAAKIDWGNPAAYDEMWRRTDWKVPNTLTGVNDEYTISQGGETTLQPRLNNDATWKKMRIEIVSGDDVIKLQKYDNGNWVDVEKTAEGETILDIDNNADFKVVNLNTAGFANVKITAWDNHNVTKTITFKANDATYNYELCEVADGQKGTTPNRLYGMKKPATTSTGTPVIISLHGTTNDFNSDASGRVIFDSYAEQAIIIYPRAEKRVVEFFGTNPVRSWDSTGEASAYAYDNWDVKFFQAILQDLTDKNILYDKSRVYLAGYSNGGMMAYQAAAEMSDQIAAFASVAGFPINEFTNHNQGSRPLPFLHIHGTSDNVVVIKGDGSCDINQHMKNMALRNGTILNPEGVVNGNLTTYTYTVDDSKAISANRGNNEAGTNGVEFKYIKVTGMWHSANGNSDINVSETMWNYLSALSMPNKVKKTDDANSEYVYNNGWSTLKFRADLNQDAVRSDCWIPGNAEFTGDYTANRCLLQYGIANYDSHDGKYVNISNAGDHNVYKSVQLQTRDNNHDGFVQGYHRMRLRIKGNTESSTITVRLKDIRTGENVLYKRFNADTRTKPVTGGDYTNNVWKEIKTNFSVPAGWHEYQLVIDKGSNTDDTGLDFVEIASGSFSPSEVTPEAAYNPDNLPSLADMNIVMQPHYGVGGRGIAKSYFPIANLMMMASYTVDTDTGNYTTENGVTRPVLTSNWADNFYNNSSNQDNIYMASIVREIPNTNDSYNYAAPVETADDVRSIAFLYGKTGEDVNTYTLTKTQSADNRYGLNLSQFGAAGMPAFALTPTDNSLFPTKAMFVMKVAGTLDITMLAHNVGSTDQPFKVYYVNNQHTAPTLMTDENLVIKAGQYHGENNQWIDGTGWVMSLTAKVRLQHLGDDGSCTLFFCYEGSQCDDIWTKGFVVKRPDLKVTIGRTDLETNETDYANNFGTPFGKGNPYRWDFRYSGFNTRDVYNLGDYRTYICGSVVDRNGNLLTNEDEKWNLEDHLLVYSENSTSYAHFVGTVGNEHLQFDSPTMFRYNHYEEDEGVVSPGIQDINYDGDGSVFDPIVNDGLKVNVTGSGWFKVRARVPSDQNKVKMTIMTSVNGGNEHIKLLRYFKLPNDGRYHDYVAFLKASSHFGENEDPEKTQQSLFVVFEDIGDDIYTTVPEGMTDTSVKENDGGLTEWQGDQNNFRVDLQYMEWLNDDVPDYVYQRGQYLFHSQTANDNVAGHDNNSLGRCRQTVYGKGGSGSSTTTPILYWQAGGAHKNAMVMLDKKYASQVDANGYITNPDGTDDAVYSYGDMYEITNHEKDASGTWYTTYKLIKNDDSALEDGRWAYDTNWMMVSGGTNPKYDEDGNYSTFGLAPDRGHSEAFTFGGQWDMAPMPTLGLSHFVESNYGENEDEIDNPNVDGVYTGATCQIESHNHNASNPAAASPLWQGAHTEMQSPRIFNQSYNESKRPGGTSSIDKFTWIGGTEWVARNKETNTEYDLPVSGPFYRFMPMKNVKITAYVVSGNAEGKIYVLDETGKIVKTNASGKDWYRLGSVTVENGTIDSDGIITPYSGDNSPLTSDNKRAKTVKITISARAGKEYFLTSTGMAIGVATMYFDEIPTSEIAKRSISSSAKAMHAPAGDGSNFLLYGEAKNTANIGSIIDDSGSKTVDVKIDRAFTAGTWQSIVLPFTMNEELFEKVFGKGAMALSFEKIEKNIVYLLHHQYNMITAGRPVFIRPTQNVEANYLIEDVTLSTKEVTSDDFIGVDDETYKNRYRFTGTLDPKTADGDCMIRGSLVMAPSDAGMSGKLMYMTKRTPSRALRSWIEPATEAPEAAAAKLMYAAFDYTGNLIESEELTGIESILNDYFDNENAFVIHEYDKVYDLNGRAVATGEGVDALPSGVYIVNGKKFVK